MLLISALALLSVLVSSLVETDSRSIVIDGKREFLLAGSIHYPRSTPEMWDSLFAKSKAAGLNTIDTYVFWDIHEPQRGKYDFTGNKNLRLFLQKAKAAGLYVILRIGPYVCAEWNYGGFPAWLREIEGIDHRGYNPAFIHEMTLFVTEIVGLVQDLLHDNGGPIVLLQIENEYGNFIGKYPDGQRYIEWATDFAQNITSAVPWFVCVLDTVKSILNTCNGFYCDHYRESRPFKNQMIGWTENWSGWFQNWGEAKPHRPSEDLAYATARFLAEGGTYVGYYMWHGGTNFGRTAGGPFQTTSYDYDAPLDEFGFENEPKYSHLKALHGLINVYSYVILHGEITRTILDKSISATVFSLNKNSTVKKLVLLSNTDPHKSKTVQFEGYGYDLPKWSVSFVEDSRITYSTANIQFEPTKQVMKEVATPKKTFSIREQVGIWDESLAIKAKEPLDHISLTKDLTDYCTYQTEVMVSKSTKTITLSIQEAQDWVMIYLDDEFVGSGKGVVNLSFSVKNKYYQNSDEQRNLIIKTQTMGLVNNAAHSQNYKRGLIGPVIFNGQDLTRGIWKHQVGLEGELREYVTSSDVAWTDARQSSPFTWYKYQLDKISVNPESGYVLDMSFASKGNVWFNGNHLGRYWDIIGAAESRLDPKESLLTVDNLHSLVHDKCEYSGVYSGSKCRFDVGEPSQHYYHVPRDWIFDNQPNTVVIFEENGLKDPSNLKLLQVDRK